MSSTKLSVSEEAIQAENNLRTRVIELHKDLLNATKKLLDDYAQNQNGLGRHNASIQALLQDLEDESHDDKSVKVLVRRLKLSAANRQHHIDQNRYNKQR